MADSKQIRAEIVTRLLNDAAFFDRFLQDPDAVLAEFPGLDQFDGRFLKDEIEDRAGLEDVAEQLGIAAPERQPGVRTLPCRAHVDTVAEAAAGTPMAALASSVSLGRKRAKSTPGGMTSILCASAP